MVRDSSPPTADNISNGVVSNGGGGVSSPQAGNRSLWASIVRGAGLDIAGESSPATEQTSNNSTENSSSEVLPESLEDINGDNNVGPPRRPAWNRPLNGAAAEPASSVIGGVASWPALSETTRPITRSPSDVSRPVSDGSAALSQAPIISQPPQRPPNNSGHSNSTGNNSNPSRPRSRNRGGNSGGGSGSGGSSGGGPSQNTFNPSSLPMPPPFPVFEVPYGMLPAVHDNSVRGARPIGGVGASQSHSGIENSSQRSNSRRGGYGTRPRGEHHNNHGGRRDQDRRDAHHPPHYVPPPPPMGYMPPPLPAGAGPFLPPPHMRVFPGQIGFDMPPPFYYVQPMPPESFRAMPIVPPLAPMIFPPANEDPITSMIIKQIDFYFSDDNLVKDSFLRSKMDDQGWVPIGLIASFRRVQQLTKDIPLILESLRHSSVVEVQGEKVRRSNEWSKWLLSSGSGSGNSDSGSHTPTSASENMSSLQEGNNVDVMDTPPPRGNDSAEVHPMS